MAAPLPLARYRLDFIVDAPLTLPAFAGSTLRGAFGTAFRAGVCVTGAKQCDGCPLLATCPYAVVFEPRSPAGGHPLQDFSQIPRPYVVEPPTWGERGYAPGETLSFHIVLAGRALTHLPLILSAFQQSLGHGVGKGDGTARLAQVWHVVGDGSTLVLDGPRGILVEHDATVSLESVVSAESITLHFDAPLRLQVNGRRATAHEFTPRRLLMSLIRRVSLIHEFHGPGPLSLDFTALADRAEVLGSEKDLRWRDWTRYSSRQHRTMDLGGVVGRWTLTGDLRPFMLFLHLGQWLHVGKEAAFGLGGYRLEMA
jgi:hypothetical protein